MNGKIVPLQNLEGTESVFPITVSKAVMVNDTETLDSKLTNIDTQKQDVCIKQASGSSIHLTDSVKSGMILDRAVKNILGYTLDSLKAINTGGSWSDNVYTHNGVSFTVNEDMGITVNGEATGSYGGLKLIEKPEITRNMYLSGCKQINGLELEYSNYDDSYYKDFGNGVLIDKQFDYSVYVDSCIQLKVETGYSIADNVTIYPMLEEAEEGQTKPSNYVPYAGYEITARNDSEPYAETKISITPETTFPVYGLESQEGVTNIINPYNVDMTVQYAVNKVGKGLLDNSTKINGLNDSLGGFTPVIDDSGKITGYKTTIGGADTVFPFSSVNAELLWTNPNPTSSFASQTISLDLNNYSHVIIKYKSNNRATPSSTMGLSIMPTDGSLMRVGGGALYDSPYTRGLRDGKANKTGVTFDEGSISSDTRNNTIVIPLNIYGINLYIEL